jgi:hypothetical protein
MTQILPKYRVIVQRVATGAPEHVGKWAWFQVARNGIAAAVSPATHVLKANAVRSARRQVDALNWGFEHWLPVGERSTDPGRAVLVISD